MKCVILVVFGFVISFVVFVVVEEEIKVGFLFLFLGVYVLFGNEIEIGFNFGL